MTTPAVIVHVTAGASWLLASLAIAMAARAPRWLVAPCLAAAVATIGAGIDLWHARHTGPPGPVEHLLTIASFCALVALGLQLPIVGPLLVRQAARRLEAAPLLLLRISAAILAAAAAAMIGSLSS